MLRLFTFCILLAVVVAQSGYEYNKPGRPFSLSPTNQPNQGYPSGSSATAGPSGPGSSPSQGFPGQGPTGSSFPGQSPSQPPYAGQPQSSPSYSGQAPSGPSYPGTAPSGPTSPGQAPSRTPYQGQSPIADSPSQSGSPGYFEQGQNYPNAASPTGSDNNLGPNYGGQAPIGKPSGQLPGQGQNVASPSGPSAPSGLPYPSGTVGSRPGTGSYSDDSGAYPGGDYSAIPGEPDKDYPILTEIPKTSFKCDAQPYPGYYADVEARCQVFHVCANKIQYDFLCPNGTIFSQDVFVCVWWNQFDCNSAPSLYDKNANLYINTKADFQPTGVFSGLNNYPQGDVNLDYIGALQPQGPSGFPSGPQGPSGFSGSPQVPSSSYPGKQPQGPSSSYPGSQTPQDSSSGYPGNQGAQGPAGYPGSQGTQGTAGYTGGQGSQGSEGYPGNQAGHSPADYPGSQGSPGQGTASYPGSQGYPGAQSPQGQSPSSYKPSGPSTTYTAPSGPQGYSSSQGTPKPSGQDSSQGYPSGKPSGPSFPSGRPQQSGSPSPTPNREYLPPV